MLQNRKQASPDANIAHQNPPELLMHCALITQPTPPRKACPSGPLYVLRDASMGARQALCSPVPSLPLSFYRIGPMGETTVASHVLLLANDKVAATALMNYAG